MSTTDETRLKIVKMVDDLRLEGVGVETACPKAGVSTPTYYAHKKQLVSKGLYTDPLKKPKPDEEEEEEQDEEDEVVTYEEIDSIVDALCDAPEDPTGDAVEQVLENWAEYRDRLLTDGTSMGKMAGTLLRHLMTDIECAIAVAEDEAA